MKIAVCGSAPSSAHLGPFADKSYRDFIGNKPDPKYPPAPAIEEEWEIWGCSPGLFGTATRVNRWFELHRWEPGAAWFSPEYVQFLREFKGPVYTGGPVPEIPNHVVYPIESVETEFSAFFLTSSLSLMAAIAIRTIEAVRAARKEFRESGATHIITTPKPGGITVVDDLTTAKAFIIPEGITMAELQKDDGDDVIGFWGVDMSANEEYSRQKPGCWHFGLEILRRGIGLYYPPESDLFCPEPIYGLCEWDHEYIKATARMRELNQRSSQAQAQIQQATVNVHALGGAVDDLNYMIKNLMTPQYRLPAGMVIRKPQKA